MDVVRVRQRAGHLTFGIVVAGHDEHGDIVLFQAPHLADEIQTGIVVFPVPVKQVTGNEYKVDGLFQGQVDQVFKSTPRCLPDFIDGRPLVFFEAMKGAVQIISAVWINFIWLPIEPFFIFVYRVVPNRTFDNWVPIQCCF